MKILNSRLRDLYGRLAEKICKVEDERILGSLVSDEELEEYEATEALIDSRHL